jgi:hypothetical protein
MELLKDFQRVESDFNFKSYSMFNFEDKLSQQVLRKFPEKVNFGCPFCKDKNT